MIAIARVASAVATSLVVGCVAGPMNVAQSAHDPSSPSAPEGVDPLVAANASNAAVVAVDGHEHGAPTPKEGVVYACPMHAEVTSNAPGVCPKCNMKLVPKK